MICILVLLNAGSSTKAVDAWINIIFGSRVNMAFKRKVKHLKHLYVCDRQGLLTVSLAKSICQKVPHHRFIQK